MGLGLGLGLGLGVGFAIGVRVRVRVRVGVLLSHPLLQPTSLCLHGRTLIVVVVVVAHDGLDAPLEHDKEGVGLVRVRV